MTVLVTGGAGYIGSHTVVELMAAGHDVVIFDNFSNSKPDVIHRIAKIVGKAPVTIMGDVRNQAEVEAALRTYNVTSVLHFAALKSVGESVEKPLEYYKNNVEGSLSLLRAMALCDVKSFVFSSSATVYGVPQKLPIAEDHPLSAVNPYGQTKIVVENMLRDSYVADRSWRIAILRYFNPVGAHDSGLIGEDPNGIPNNLVPYVAKVAAGDLPHVNILGNDYETPDGTGVRDYIHVVDLAKGHVAALDLIKKNSGLAVLNLGTGVGHSVLDVVKAYETVAGKKIPYEIAPRRAGDVAACYADPAFAEKVLGWRAERSLQDMCATSWKWQQNSR